MLAVPLLAFEPDQSPLAVQEVGLLVADHVNDELPPTAMLIGFAFIVTTGLGGNVTVTVAVAVALVPA